MPKPITAGPLRSDWRFFPSVSLSGDSFGYHWIDSDHFAIYLLDVSGHGWGAALLSVSVINVLRSHALPQTDFRKPHQVLFALNNTFPAEKHNDLFFTIWYGVYNIKSQKLVYAGGGHPPAILITANHSNQLHLDQLHTPNFIIGGKPDTDYQWQVHDIRRPSRLYVFSDGVYDITVNDGSIWGLNDFLDFSINHFKIDKPNLDLLINYVQHISFNENYDDDFTILEIAFV